MSQLFIAVLFLTFCCSPVCNAGEFGSTAIGEWLSWKPTVCEKPAKLFFQITDIGSFNAAVEEYNHQLHAVRAYRGCISREAQQDAEAVNQAISIGLDQANEKIRLETESALLEIESARSLLQ